MINWGILGLGRMASIFAESFKNQKNINLKGIASYSNLNNFGKKFNVDKNFFYEDYSELLKSTDIDAVYISTLNNSHYHLIIEAINNNKKILCEKPFVISLEEAKIIYEKLNKKRHSFVEAIAYRSHPILDEILSIINNGEIGDIKEIHSSFGFKVKKVKNNSRLFNKELGGGSILDLGCYPISFAELFRNKFGKIEYLKTSGNFAFPEVDDHAELEYVMNDNIYVNAKVSFKEHLSNDCFIYGSKKKLRVTTPWLPGQKSIIEIYQGDNYYKKFIISKRNVYSHQLNLISNYFSENFENNFNNIVTIDKSYNILKILDYWMKRIKN